MAHSQRFSSFAMLVVAAVAFLSAVSAYPQQPPWKSGPFAGEPKEVLAAASTVAADKYPYTTVLLEEVEYSVDQDRRITRTRRFIYRIDSPKALQGWGRTSVYWEPWHQEKPQLKARVITADGNVFWLDEKTLVDSPARQQSDDVYTDTRYFGGPLPGIAVGAVVEEYSVRKDSEPLFEAGTVQRYTIGGGNPTAASRVVIDYPQSLPVTTKVVNLPNLTQHKEESGGRIRLIFEHDRIEALPAVPELVSPETVVRGLIQFTTAASWKQVNDAYYGVVSERVRTADVAELVKQTVQRNDPRALTIAKLVARLHREVRYTGIEFGEAAIVPRFPDETLRRHFGDCKDKSILLVTMLQAAGIPANLALIRTEKPDIDEDLPGFGLFDHAIVDVPGPTPLWIDATAEYNVAGNLPGGIRGKLALVIDGKSERPLRIPQSQSSEHKLVETREFFLSDYGPARVVETSEGVGFFDSSYRSYFGGPANKNRTENLEAYARNVYLAEAVTEPAAGDGRELTTPFKVELAFSKARRGFTDIDEAVAAVRIDGLVSSMPKALTTAKDDKKKDDKDPEPPRTVDYFFEPYQVEWRYKIHPAAGFRLHAPPAAVDRNLGPARFTETWAAAKDGGIEGTVRFDSVKGRYTVQEGDAARDAIVQALKEPALMIRFDNVGAALIAQGKIRDGLAEFERIIAAEPKQPLHQVRLSRALLQAGLGEQARREAQAAVNLDGKSVIALNNLGWMLEHDILGRRFRGGFDRDGAIAAYKKAMEADSKDLDARASLGIISEFSPTGERYAEGSRLPEAIAAYEGLKALDKDRYDRFEINLVLCRLYQRDYAGVLSQVGNRAGEERFRNVAIAATAEKSGTEAALLLSSRITGGQQDRSAALRNAAQLLVRIRDYQHAADLLAAGVQGAEDAANIQAQVELYRRTKSWNSAAPAASDPASAVHKLFVGLGTHAPNDEVTQQLSSSWRSATTEKARKVRIRLMRVVLMNVLGNTELPNTTVLDLILSNTTYNAEGDDTTGYRVWVHLPDSEAQPVFVVREGGVFRVLAFRDWDPLGWEALARLKAGKTREAAKLLDWARQQVERGEAEDPIGGNLFARLWDKGAGSKAGRDEIELAALALVSQATEQDLIPDIERAARTLPEAKRADAQRLMWQAYIDVDKWTDASPLAAKLFEGYPKSQTAFVSYAITLLGEKHYDLLERIARERLQNDPDDEAAVMMLTESLVAQNQTAAARVFIRSRIKAGRAKADELNSYAWEALFDKVDDESLEIARRSSAETNQRSYGILHTLACLYAEVGKTAEARELILKAMDANYLEELDSPLWYVYGRIAEQYGQFEAARSAYAHVDKPEPGEPEQGSTYRLAVMRLAAMDVGTKRAPEKAQGSGSTGPR